MLWSGILNFAFWRNIYHIGNLNSFSILGLGGERVHEQTDRPFTVVASL